MMVFSSSRRAFCTMATGAVPGRYFRAWSTAMAKLCGRPLLRGLYRTTGMPAEKNASSRFSIISSGVRRSERLITAKSPERGEPARDAAALAAVTPGMISTSIVSAECSRTSRTMLAMPYTPASPPDTIATLRVRARSTASCARSTSFPMEPEMTFLPSRRGLRGSR
ncbi:MAG: hypothetical protein A4E33_00716 [Methanoregula sp. PtaB.Bin085]|nr:MAG: hypothetical protein A4E33_00716 [Methanoregula sp. PtaB.Bin085]